MFNEVPSQFDFPAEEKRILAFWEKDRIYEKSLEQRKGGKPFVFFEGPPTANGLPHPGHCLTRAIKDLFPRYKTMTGHYCLRKGGWDTHGLPVEVEVCKELGIHSKEEIEKYGVEPFNRKCLESVFRYTKEWEDMTRRLGFWVNLDEAYVTYHQSYIESVWWSLKQLFDAGLLYQGHKIVWWWAQGGTALSAGEVGQGYREVDDPSVYVRFPIVVDDRAKKAGIPDKTSLLVWTTTPWTLPSNTFAAVHKDFDYAVVHDEESGERLIFAAALVEQIAKKVKKTEKWKVERTVKGQDLVGLRYVPPFPDCYYEKPAQYRHEGQHHTSQQRWSDFQIPARAFYDSRVVDHVSGEPEHVCFRVVPGTFVTLDTGTGLVHEAPAFGEVDFDLWKSDKLRFFQQFEWDLFCAVAPNGAFTEDAPPYKGRWVKDCDKDIIRDLKERGLVLHQEQYRHDYPFCWRAEEDPLIQYPRKSWFIRTTQFKEAMLENNQRINWLPEHIKEGRFGKFLESNVDWSLSRERYWGTPLPIWVCEKTGHMEAVGSYDELLAKPDVRGLDVWENAKKATPGLSEHLKVHKPYIDAITYQSPSDKAWRMRRVPEVIDCWYDSGAMPFAQWGFPHKNLEMFMSQFPADFISEALDQTRGWFYSLTAISVMLFSRASLSAKTERGIVEARAHGWSEEKLKSLREMIAIADESVSRSGGGQTVSMATEIAMDGSVRNANMTATYPMPFRNCIVLGLLMGEDGLKMSKSKKNYKEPSYIFEKEGADAMRWLFFSGQTPWTSIRFQESAIAEGQREFLIRLYNCYSFFVIYANIDRWVPDPSPERERRESCQASSEMDRWILSELHRTTRDVRAAMDAYDNYTAARALNAFVDALSNWYVRRSRDRYWKGGMDDDKQQAYSVLYDCLVTTAKLIAPFTPFFAESMYQNLVRGQNAAAPPSVHLCDYPAADEKQIDEKLSKEMSIVRDVVSLGRSARAEAKVKTRQPLPLVEIVLADKADTDWLREHEALFCDELNVKAVEFIAEADHYVNYQVKPNFKSIGPKFGRLGPAIKQALAAAADPARMRREIDETGRTTLTVEGQTIELTTEDVQVELSAKPGWAAAQNRAAVVVLKTEITDDLRAEGLARELVHHVQQTRKTMNLRYEQRIDLAIVGDADIGSVINRFAKYIQGETLAQNLLSKPLARVEPVKVDVEGRPTEIYVNPL